MHCGAACTRGPASWLTSTRVAYEKLKTARKRTVDRSRMHHRAAVRRRRIDVLRVALPLPRGGHLSRQFANLMRRVGASARPGLLWSQLPVLEFYLLAESGRVQRDGEYGED